MSDSDGVLFPMMRVSECWPVTYSKVQNDCAQDSASNFFEARAMDTFILVTAHKFICVGIISHESLNVLLELVVFF